MRCDSAHMLEQASRYIDPDRDCYGYNFALEELGGHIRQVRSGEEGVLTIPVKGVYFDQIRSGTKPEEFRLCTDYWRKRLVDRDYDTVVLTRGYPKAGGVEGVTRLTRRWRGYREITLTHPHFGPDPVEVFAIDVSETPNPDPTPSITPESKT